MENSLELISLVSSINKFVLVSSCSNTGSVRDQPYWTYRKNSLELIELSSINKVVLVSSCSDSYWTSRKNSSELIELFSINKVSIVKVFSCSNTGSIRNDPYWISRRTEFRTLQQIELPSINKVKKR